MYGDRYHAHEITCECGKVIGGSTFAALQCAIWVHKVDEHKEETGQVEVSESVRV